MKRRLPRTKAAPEGNHPLPRESRAGGSNGLALDSQTLWELRGAAGLLGAHAARTRRLTESQIAFIFQQAGDGAPLSEICAAVGLSDSAYLKWRRQFGGLLPSEYNYVRDLEAQVRRLQRELADLLDMPEDFDGET